MSNTRLAQEPLEIRGAAAGAVLAVAEVPIPAPERWAVGYLPHGFEGADLGESTSRSVAGAAFRLLRVRVADRVQALPRARPPRAPSKVWLRAAAEPREAVLRRPHFRALFDGLLLDWRYFQRSAPALAQDAAWLRSERLSVAADLSAGIERYYPKLRLCDLAPTRAYNESLAALEAVLAALAAMGGKDLVLTLHDQPEVSDPGAVRSQVASTVQRLAARAADLGVAVHLRQSAKNTFVAGAETAAQAAWARRHGLQLAPHAGYLAREGVAANLTAAQLLLLAGAPEASEVAPVGPGAEAALAPLVRAARAAGATLVLDAAYPSEGEEDRDTVWLESLLRS